MSEKKPHDASGETHHVFLDNAVSICYEVAVHTTAISRYDIARDGRGEIMNGEVEYIIIGANGKQYGPMNLETLKSLIRDERAGAVTQVWDSTTREWHEAQQIEELSEFYPEEGIEAGTETSYEAPAEYAEPHTSNLAIAAMWCGIAAVPTFCCMGWVLGILGLILGFVARNDVKKYGYEGATYANVGIICGLISLALTAIMLAIFSNALMQVIGDIFKKTQG